MSTAEQIIGNLHPLEIKTILAFKGGQAFFASELLKITELTEARLRMALEWLQLKKVIGMVAERKEILISLTEACEELRLRKIPELRIYQVLTEKGTLAMADLAAAIGEDIKETNIAVANLKKDKIVDIQAGGLVSPIAAADLSEMTARQELIQRIGQLGSCNQAELDERAKELVDACSRKRGKGKGFFKILEKTDKQFGLSELGQELCQMVVARGLTGEEISQLTPEMLKNGSWKTQSFRAYNIEAPVSRIVVGKRNPYRTFLDSVKQKLIALGFEEMRGPLVESEFWNMDALYMPQFHPAREIHDAYYVKNPSHCQEIKEPNYSNVARAHEDGGESGSKGWRYQFDRERTKRLVLRSQGTALSIRQLSEKPNIPGKYFGIARCFRYDTVDSTHAPDFFQVEGIVLGDEINFRHLLGLLKLFAMEMARTKEMKFVPAYFPFTEPSVEIHMKHPDLGWIELGGAGIFRPEVTKAQGIDVPVIAWGLGLDRMAMVALDIQDIRDLFANDLEVTRAKRVKGNI